MYVCMYVSICLSVGRISRPSLKTKRWNKLHKLKSIFAQKWIVRIFIIKLCSWATAWFTYLGLLVIWFSVLNSRAAFMRVNCHHSHRPLFSSQHSKFLIFFLLLIAGDVPPRHQHLWCFSLNWLVQLTAQQLFPILLRKTECKLFCIRAEWKPATANCNTSQLPIQL